MINLEISDRITGFLILLLMLLLFYALKTAGTYSRPQRSPSDEHVFVQIEGDLKFPGVYAFGHRPSLTELIGRAGGLSSAPFSPESFKNFTVPKGAEVIVLRDGDKWWFYQRQMSAFHKLTLGIPISLNRESEEGLTSIPGIGPELAKSIVQERSERGGFKSLDEIVSIRGISNKLFTRIKPFLTL